MPRTISLNEPPDTVAHGERIFCPKCGTECRADTTESSETAFPDACWPNTVDQEEPTWECLNCYTMPE